MRKSIMIIDDEPVRRKRIYDILKLTGENIFSASAGEEAMSRIPHEKPELVLINLFSEKVDGITFIRKLRTYVMGKKIKVIGVTEHGHEESRSGMIAGADGVLRVSFQPYELLDVVAGCLGLEKIVIPQSQMIKRREVIEEVVQDYRKSYAKSKSTERKTLGVVLLLPGGNDPLLALTDGTER